MGIKTDLLIIGAGPFGLSMAACADHLNIDYMIVGRPMEFWKKNMPGGMRLRSGPDWHLDPICECTIFEFFKASNIDPGSYNPIPINLYLQYTDWFIEQKRIDPINKHITKLDYYPDDQYRFRAYIGEDEYIQAKFVLIAIGFGYFKNIPEDLVSDLPDSKYSHTADLIEFSKLKSKSCIIVGGRQSAFEWALLTKEAGANKIYIVHKHKTPEFTESDWSWVTPLLVKMVESPDYYLKLSEDEKDEINKRFWQEGRLKLEPWLKEAEQDNNIQIHAKKQVASTAIATGGSIDAYLNDGTRLTSDHILFATGYKVDLQKVPFLKAGNLLQQLKANNGFPKLRINFQSSIEGLYFTSLPATADFGAFFGFTVSCNTSSIIIGNAIKEAIS